ncbi:transcription factor S-II-domain-containing protein [Aspergillus varians]
MTVQFCEDCGNLLDNRPSDTLQCELCGKTAKKVNRETLTSGPRVEMDCIKCPSKEVTYAQVQMRSADEGSTIFYTCLKCGHK